MADICENNKRVKVKSGFSRRFTKAMNELKVTPSLFTQKVYVTPTMMYAYMDDKAKPGLKVLSAIASAFNLDLNWLCRTDSPADGEVVMYTKPEEAKPEESRDVSRDSIEWLGLMGELDRLAVQNPMDMVDYQEKASLVAERMDACKALAKYVLGPDAVLDLNVLERFYRIMDELR